MQVLILKGFAVDEEAAVVVEVHGVGVAIWIGRQALLSGWSCWRRDVGMAGLRGWMVGWHWRLRQGRCGLRFGYTGRIGRRAGLG